MKRLMILAVLCAFVLSAAAASAVDVKTSGNLLVNAVWKDNWTFAQGKNGNDTKYTVKERADLYFTATANENLKGVLGFRSDKGDWGTGAFANGAGGAAGGAQIYIRDAYIDFNWPGTDTAVEAGYSSVTLPSAIGGSFLQDDRAGHVFVTQPFSDAVSASVGYIRVETDSNSSLNQSQLDAWLLAVPVNLEGFSFTPFGLYAAPGSQYRAGNSAGLASFGAVNTIGLGNAVGGYKSAYWLGMAFTMDLFDPIVVKADLDYGAVDNKDEVYDRNGWYFDLGVEYKGLDFMTPEAYFVYTSGEDSNVSNGSERMPTLIGDWAVGSFWFGGDSITSGSIDDEWDQNGFWLLGLSMNDIQSFADGLTHNVHVLYIQGTNDKNGPLGSYGRYLTEKDTLWEVSATTAYKIYDELTLYVDLGYLNLDADTGVWGAGNNGGDAWKVTTGMVFKF